MFNSDNQTTSVKRLIIDKSQCIKFAQRRVARQLKLLKSDESLIRLMHGDLAETILSKKADYIILHCPIVDHLLTDHQRQIWASTYLALHLCDYFILQKNSENSVRMALSMAKKKLMS